MEVLFSIYMVGAIIMLCFVILAMLIAIMGGTIPWSWFVKAVFIAATWPIMLCWGFTNVIVQRKNRN